MKLNRLSEKGLADWRSAAIAARLCKSMAAKADNPTKQAQYEAATSLWFIVSAHRHREIQPDLFGIRAHEVPKSAQMDLFIDFAAHEEAQSLIEETMLAMWSDWRFHLEPIRSLRKASFVAQGIKRRLARLRRY